MTSKLKLNVDYTGIYILPPESDIGEYEILMSDSMRFKDQTTNETTFSEAIFSDKDDELEIFIQGQFQERPIEMGTRHVRSDIYINKKYSKEIMEWIEATFNPTFIEKLPSGPDPSQFVRGSKWIPLEGKPSMVVYTSCARFVTPRWEMKAENRRAFIDIESDKEFGRVQVHLGIRFNKYTLLDGSPTKIGRNYPATGKITFDAGAVNGLYSYLRTHAV